MKHSAIVASTIANRRLDELAGWLAVSAVPLGLTGYTGSRQIRESAMYPATLLPGLLSAPLVGDWLEIGAGDGALGLAVAITCPAVHMTLADQRQRVAAHLDITIRRLAISNAVAQQARMGCGSPAGQWGGVCFRALAAPTAALETAQHHARRWICAWHSPSLLAYDAPPRGFDILARHFTTRADLCATLYERRR